ncbi:shikimate dehydrogenase [Pusillimonas sp. DMV24BSW_D]|uniref:shikimate dehydrogenase n=1 Tax=Neopusillimonas aestuarii TaxID=2716226 RepID=UPI00140C961A|nr:shikimate dehydrogenase [Pusillimonas sp. DMV24BSW_D]QIM48760.1 shikimate dehydrogenase [Pusillimonas sp. DMV24BSW_D]
MTPNQQNHSKVKRFAVIGNPVAHSKSPQIHAAFAKQTGIQLQYDLLPTPIEAFESVVERFFAEGGSGLNVTVPFKERAWTMAQGGLTERARVAGAVNTLWWGDDRLHGCNTDGVGLLADLHLLGVDVKGRDVLLVGAGGAARGACAPILEAGCTRLHIVNRTEQRATELHQHIARELPHYAAQLSSGGLDQAQGLWSIVINATSSSISQAAPNLPGMQYMPGALAYDMFYAAHDTAFLQAAKAAGADRTADGLGMLVGQAAAGFAIWHGVTPEIEPVLTMLRAQLSHS